GVGQAGGVEVVAADRVSGARAAGTGGGAPSLARAQAGGGTKGSGARVGSHGTAGPMGRIRLRGPGGSLAAGGDGLEDDQETAVLGGDRHLLGGIGVAREAGVELGGGADGDAVGGEAGRDGGLHGGGRGAHRDGRGLGAA